MLTDFIKHVSASILLALLVCLQPGLTDAANDQRQQIYQLLKDGKVDAVRSLPVGEREMLMALLALKAGRTVEAVTLLKSEKLAKNQLAALIRAEAYRQQSVSAANRAGGYAHSIQDDIRKLERADLSAGLDAAELRLQAFVNKLNGHISLPFDLLDPGSGIFNVFMVDKSKSSMSIYALGKKGKLEHVADTTIATDANTPVGIYHLGNRQTSGPLAFPFDYPNVLDQLQDKNTADVLMHAGDSPQGGISLGRRNLQDVEKYIRPGRSWLVIGEYLLFNALEKKKELRGSVYSDLKRWRQDWESRNASAYLSHYHPQFKSEKHDYTSWSKYKRRVNGKKSFIKVKLSDFIIIHNPGYTQLGEAVLVEFAQRYKSNNYSSSSHKRLYMVRNHAGDHWKIVSEREVNALAVNTTTGSRLQIADKRTAGNTEISWAINLGSFDSKTNADKMLKGIQLSGKQQPYVANVSVQGKQRYRVRVGFYDNRESAVKSMISICKQQALPDCWLEQIKR